MARINEDGNLLGRCTALAIVVLSVVYVGRFWEGGSCPMGSKGAKCCLMPH